MKKTSRGSQKWASLLFYNFFLFPVAIFANMLYNIIRARQVLLQIKTIRKENYDYHQH